MKENDKAKDFCLPDSKKKEKCLSDYNGKWVILYFYPKDNTPGCTLEAVEFSDKKHEFLRENAVILGVSRDSCESHQNFVDQEGLTITLLSDEESLVHKEYDTWRKKKFMGKEFMGTVRTTILIDDEGTIKKRWDNVKAKGHAQEVLESLIKFNKSKERASLKI